MTEFMVDMHCEGCVSAVRKRLEPLEGVERLDVDLANQVVRVLGTSPLKTLESALEQSGRKARLIGQGSPENMALTAAVAEFKGPAVHGVVRFAQVSQNKGRIEAQFDGLAPGGTHAWCVNQFGDLTRGAASTGAVFNPELEAEPAGDLGTLQANEAGHAEYSAANEKLKVWDLIGRAVVIYEPGATLGEEGKGLTAAVVARSAGIGENYKQLCTCDGTVIWEATPHDYVKA